MVQKTHKHRLIRRVFPCLFYILYTSTELQHGTQLEMKSMPLHHQPCWTFNILLKKDSIRVEFCNPYIKHILKQSIKIVTVLVHRRWERTVFTLLCLFVPKPRVCGIFFFFNDMIKSSGFPEMHCNARNKYSRLPLSRSPRDCLKFFEISVPRHSRFAELRKKYI